METGVERERERGSADRGDFVTSHYELKHACGVRLIVLRVCGGCVSVCVCVCAR